MSTKPEDCSAVSTSEGLCFRLQEVPKAFPGLRWKRESISGRE